MTAVPTPQDRAYQQEILQHVSRTFALTIPQLPLTLRDVVSNAYLLCRIADTVEDEATLAVDQKRHLSEQFTGVVDGSVPAETFAGECYPLLSQQTLEAERDLIQNTPAVIRITHDYNPRQRQALERCVRIMAEGMAYYQELDTSDGLEDQPAMDRYCYYVAGVVGEMLTELFCDYSETMNRQRSQMMQLAVSFGQGLQMTNILKDIWEDNQRGACWLPRDLFRRHGVVLKDMKPGHNQEGFGEALGQLIGVARAHLENALNYTLMIPSKEKGIRKFCLWALGMAALTLNKINEHRNFTAGNQVKISRRSVKATILTTNLAVSSNRSLSFLFKLATKKLPSVAIHETLPPPSFDAQS